MAAIAFQRRVWENKIALLLAGAEVEALSYGRASKDKKKEKYSVAQQLRMNRENITQASWIVAGEFSDNDKPASRHASEKSRQRADFDRLLLAIKSGRGDVLVMTDMSRSQRMLGVFAMLRDLCYDNGLFFWMVEGNVYDLRVSADRASLGQQALNAESQVDSISDNTSRGLQGQIADGRPQGKVPYGYERFKNRKTGAFESQLFDMTQHVAIHADGTEEIYTTYQIVREIFWKLRRLITAKAIANDLNSRGIPSPGGKRWSRQTVESIASNAAYIGKRVHFGDIVSEGQWEGIVEPKVFYNTLALTYAFTDSRRTGRGFARKWLLSYASRCGECGAWMKSSHRGAKAKAAGRKPVKYTCSGHNCSGAEIDAFDSYVEACLVSWLSRKDIYEQLVSLTARQNVNIDVYETAIAEAQAELRALPGLVTAGKISVSLAGDIEAGLNSKISGAQDAIRAVAIPEVLMDLVGPDAAEQWENIADLELRRDIIKLVAAPTIRAANKNPRMPIAERVSFGGMMGGLAA
ncbi:recombinase family protein [Kribbella solani]|uniref:recombinase family protein n=1 Tax=Kribbella solani TaxID=236067 RepID=UPI0029A11C9F|nr:recombinase family protein [Kribbella solani]MDX2974322.1 recombinase family protein [Kribbella solani]